MMVLFHKFILFPLAVPSLHLLPKKIQAAPPKEKNSKYFTEKDQKALVESLIHKSLLKEEKHLKICIFQSEYLNCYYSNCFSSLKYIGSHSTLETWENKLKGLKTLKIGKNEKGI